MAEPRGDSAVPQSLPAIGPHDLRQTPATRLARGGLDRLALKTVTRHSRIQTTEAFYFEIDREQAAGRAFGMLQDEGETRRQCAESAPSTSGNKKQGKAQGLTLSDSEMARATGLEPVTDPNKHGPKRTSTALNRASGDRSASTLGELVRILSELTPEDKVLLAALFRGDPQGGDPQ